MEAVGASKFSEYRNVPVKIGVVVSSRIAKLIDLQTVYGTEDLHDFLEVLATDAHNQRIAAKSEKD